MGFGKTVNGSGEGGNIKARILPVDGSATGALGNLAKYLPAGATWANGKPNATSTLSGVTVGSDGTFSVAAPIGVGNSVTGWVTGTGAEGIASYQLTLQGRAVVPAQVGTVTATPGNGQVALSWSAPSNGGSPITDYIVEYRTSPGGAWQTFTDSVTSTPGATVPGTNEQAYGFRVSAVNLIGMGPASAEVVATPSETIAPQPLSLPYDGLYVAEGAGAGTKVATPVGLGAGSARSILSVNNFAGASVSSSMFAVAGNGDIVCGLVPTVGSDVGYEITYREVGAGQTVDTKLYVYVVALPTYVAPYLESFTGSNGDTLVHASRPRWSGTAPGLTINGSNQLASQAAVNSTAVIDTGSNNLYMKIKLGGMVATANTMRFHLRWTDAQNKVEAYISTTDNGTQGGRIAFYQYHGGLAAVSLGVPPFMGAANSTDAEIEIRIVDNRLSCYVNGALIFGPVDVSIVPPSGKIALNSQSAAIATVASTWDDFECGQYGDVSVAPDPTPVYAVDPTALKAQVPVRVSFNPATGVPSAMEYRVVNAAGAAVTGYDWMPWTGCVIGASGVAGPVIMPEGTTGSAAANWAVEVRDAGNTARLARGAMKGIGDVVAFVGQSHAQRLFTTVTATDGNDGFAFVANASVSLTPTNPGNRPITAFLNTLIPITKRPCMAVCLAYDGASSTNLKPGSANFIAALAWLRLYARRFNGWMFSNGEQNIQLATQSVYTPEWTETFAAYGSYTGQKMSDLPIGISHTHGLIGPAVTKQGSSEITRYLDQRRYEDQLRAALGANAYISHHRHDCRYNAVDYIHTEPADMRDIHAPRYARGYAWKIGKAASAWKGPEFNRLVRMSATKIRGYLTPNGILTGGSGLTDNDSTNPGDLTGGYQFVAATGYNGSQDPNSYFGATPAATPVITGFTTSYGWDGTEHYVDWDWASDPGSVAMRYPASKSAPAAGGAEVWDGGQPFGLAYETSGGIRLPGAQIQGNYGSGVLVGITPMINALAVA